MRGAVSALLALCGLFVACGDDSSVRPVRDAASDSSAAAEAAGPPDAQGSTAPAGPLAPTQQVPQECGVCCVGESSECMCPDGSLGFATCTGADGARTACSCPSEESEAPGGTIAVPPPPPPEPLACNGTPCLLATTRTALAPSACCTEQGECGARQSFLFGGACVAQDLAAPVPEADPGCPDEFPTWLDLIGCCTAAGRCGLYFQGMEDWQWGCVERAEMAELLNAGAKERDELAMRQGLTQPPRPSYRGQGCP